MYTVLVTCPGTGQTASTGIETSQATFDKMHTSLELMRCPVCDQHHRWSVGDVWLSTMQVAISSAEALAKMTIWHEQRGAVDPAALRCRVANSACSPPGN